MNILRRKYRRRSCRPATKFRLDSPIVKLIYTDCDIMSPILEVERDVDRIVWSITTILYGFEKSVGAVVEDREIVGYPKYSRLINICSKVRVVRTYLLKAGVQK